MAKDTLTAKFTIEAGFETIQAIRRALANDAAQVEFVSLLSDTVTAYLTDRIEGDFETSGTLRVSKERKTRAGPRDPIPKVENGVLTWHDPNADYTLTVGKVGSKDWFIWLAEDVNTSFSYTSKHGATFTAMKHGDGKWYAHKRIKGKLKRRYLGVAENLTAKKMDDVAFELAQRLLPSGP